MDAAHQDIVFRRGAVVLGNNRPLPAGLRGCLCVHDHGSCAGRPDETEPPRLLHFHSPPVGDRSDQQGLHIAQVAISILLARRTRTAWDWRASMEVTSLAAIMSPKPMYWFKTGTMSEPSSSFGATWMGRCSATSCGGRFCSLSFEARPEG